MPEAVHEYIFLLHEVAHQMRTLADQRARTRGMTRAQWMILRKLERTPGLSQNELATLIEVEPITVGRLIDRLEARGLVERRSDPRDRRIHRLHLTPKSKPILREIADNIAELSKCMANGIDGKMLNTIAAALKTMKANLNQAESPLKKSAG
ncbi:MAG TPA: MarR family transcriptional regulator [Xanthobacteraceae bacterium]|nr:MarR family transcriptional regulator [Xanthobacteraceae bacterium]